MNNVLSNISLLATSTIREAMVILETFAYRIVLIVNHEGKLLGTVTDGDIRRAILLNKPLTTPVNSIMNCEPQTTTTNLSAEDAVSIMHERGILHLPVLNEQELLVDMHSLEYLIKPTQKDNWVVLMAGGEGRRLLPLTADMPKPMIEVGGKPILETIIESFKSQGYSKFIISLNYLGEKIKHYFDNGDSLGVKIQYIEEQEKGGTAGCLRQLPSDIKDPFFVMNGDIVTKTDFNAGLDFHNASHATATMFVKEYQIDVPFGVVEIEGEEITNIEEKPTKSFFVNSGIYILNPHCLNFIPKTGPFDMTSLFENLREKNLTLSSFPIHEYWMDIGRVPDLEKAQATFFEHFN